jgi:hypothetical protein
MMEVKLTNVAEALANLTERGAVDPVVKATLKLSESGFVSVTDAVAYGEIKDDSLSGSVKSLNPIAINHSSQFREAQGFIRRFFIRGRCSPG